MGTATNTTETGEKEPVTILLKRMGEQEQDVHGVFVESSNESLEPPIGQHRLSDIKIRKDKSLEHIMRAMDSAKVVRAEYYRDSHPSWAASEITEQFASVGLVPFPLLTEAVQLEVPGDDFVPTPYSLNPDVDII